MEFWGWLIMIFLGGGAGFLFYQDIKEKQVYLWLYIMFVFLFILYSFIYNPLNTVFVVGSSIFKFKVLAILLFSLILVFYAKKHKIAIADVILIMIVFILFPIQIALIFMILSSILGMLIAFLLKQHDVGLVGIMSVLIVLFLLVGNLFR